VSFTLSVTFVLMLLFGDPTAEAGVFVVLEGYAEGTGLGFVLVEACVHCEPCFGGFSFAHYVSVYFEGFGFWYCVSFWWL